MGEKGIGVEGRERTGRGGAGRGGEGLLNFHLIFNKTWEDKDKAKKYKEFKF